MERNLTNVDTATAQATTPDIVVTGNPDVWSLICKASSKNQGWMKSTKAMQLPAGCVIQVTSEFRGADGAIVTCAEALTFVPGITLADLKP